MRYRAFAWLLCFGIMLSFPRISSSEWAQTSGPEGCQVKFLAPGEGKVYCVVEGYGIYRSADGGAHWSVVNLGWPTHRDITCLEWGNGTLFAGVEDCAYFSRDDGTTWRPIQVGESKKGYQRQVECLMPVGTELFIGTWDGISWYPNYADRQEGFPLELPKGEPIRYIAGIGEDFVIGGLRGALYRLRRNGSGWAVSEIVRPVRSEILCLEANGPDLFAGTDAGVFLSMDKGASWRNIGPHLPGDNYVSCLGMSGSALVVGLAELWEPMSLTGVRLMRDKGRNWTVGELGLKRTAIECFCSIEKSLLAGTSKGIFLSLDGGVTWKPSNAGLPISSHITGLASTGKSLFAMQSQKHSFHEGVCLSSDGGGTWKVVDPDLPSNANVNCLAAMGPNLLAGISERCRTEDEKMARAFLSPNEGRSWIPVSSGLPLDTDVDHLAVIDQRLYAATYKGVFTSSDNGTSWINCSEGLPLSPSVSCLKAVGQDLFAGVNYSPPLTWGQNLFAMGPPPSGRLFRLAKDSVKWKDMQIHLSSQINDLVMIGPMLFLGTYSGLYLCENYAKSPKAVKLEPSAGISVRCFVVVGPDLVMGTNRGVYIVRNEGGKWEFIDTRLPREIAVSCFSVTETALYAGTDERGVWRLPLAEFKKFLP